MVWVLPDLELLLCPPDPEPYDRTFLDAKWLIFTRHDQTITGLGFNWIFSDELVVAILSEFPYSQVGKIQWVRDMMVEFERIISRFKILTIDPANNCSINPDIIPPEVSEEIKTSWLCTLHSGINTETEMFIASHPLQETEILKCYTNGVEICDVELVRDPDCIWERIVSRYDPWVLHNLPKHGNEIYEPPDYWNEGAPFPKRRSHHGYGFLDRTERIWVWDRVEQHWDVQDNREGLDRYVRVTINGAILN